MSRRGASSREQAAGRRARRGPRLPRRSAAPGRPAGAVSLAASRVVLPAIAMPALTRGPATLTVGRLRLQRCADEPGWWGGSLGRAAHPRPADRGRRGAGVRGGGCGALARALAPRRPSGARIAVAFRWLPAPGRAPALVALDGG